MAATLPLCLALAVAIAAASAGTPSLRGPGLTGAGPTNSSAEESAVTYVTTSEDIEDRENSSEVMTTSNSTDLLLASSWNCASGGYSSGGCALYRMCQGRSVCVVNGYMVVPGAPVRGMEDINGGTAGRWDFLWSVARGQCGSDGCVLITNPVGHRTQEQLHIHFRHYNGGGAALKSRLQGSLCGTGGWRPFGICGGGQARLFDGMPGVFSAVAGAYGGGGLGNIGITVWFTSACGGGQKVMVLAAAGCSLEHSISAR